MTGLRVAAAAAAILSTNAAVAQLEPTPFTHAIRPRGIAEQCFNLANGTTIGYSFEATAPVDFNIHFHRGKDVDYPVQWTDVRAADERFTAPSTEEFCLMWTNRSASTVTVMGKLVP